MDERTLLWLLHGACACESVCVCVCVCVCDGIVRSFISIFIELFFGICLHFCVFLSLLPLPLPLPPFTPLFFYPTPRLISQFQILQIKWAVLPRSCRLRKFFPRPLIFLMTDFQKHTARRKKEERRRRGKGPKEGRRMERREEERRRRKASTCFPSVAPTITPFLLSPPPLHLNPP